MPTRQPHEQGGFNQLNGYVLPQQPHYLTFFVTLARWFGVDA